MNPLERPAEGRGETGSARVDGIGPVFTGNGVFHDMGFVGRSITVVAKEFAASSSSRWDGEVIHDPLQRVRVAFFHPVDAGNPLFELGEPADQFHP